MSQQPDLIPIDAEETQDEMMVGTRPAPDVQPMEFIKKYVDGIDAISVLGCAYDKDRKEMEKEIGINQQKLKLLYENTEDQSTGEFRSRRAFLMATVLQNKSRANDSIERMVLLAEIKTKLIDFGIGLGIMEPCQDDEAVDDFQKACISYDVCAICHEGILCWNTLRPFLMPVCLPTCITPNHYVHLLCFLYMVEIPAQDCTPDDSGLVVAPLLDFMADFYFARSHEQFVQGIKEGKCEDFMRSAAQMRNSIFCTIRAYFDCPFCNSTGGPNELGDNCVHDIIMTWLPVLFDYCMFVDPATSFYDIKQISEWLHR